VRAILMYHSIDPSGSPISVERREFERHVRWLAGGRVRVLDVPELLRDQRDGDAVALTFDDALVSFGEIAWPILREHALPVTLFVPTDHVGGSNGWNQGRLPIPWLPLMGWAELGRVAEEGVRLGAHTRSHPSLITLPGAAIKDEIVRGAERLRRETGRRAAAFAYPFGDCDERVLAVVRPHFDWACTTELRSLRGGEDPHLLPRVDAFYLRQPGRLERLGTRRLAAELSARRVVRRLRAAVPWSAS